MEKKFQVLIIGAGTGGIMVASQLNKKYPDINVGIIDPAEYHYYQPAWTLVGAGTYSFEKTKKAMKDLIPPKSTWIKDKVNKINAQENKLFTDQQGEISYDYLIVSPGLVYDYTKVPGLKEVLEDPKSMANSVYTDPEKTWRDIQNFKGGVALFTQPTTPIKCGGAPQKIMYLAEAALKKQGVRDKTKVVFATNGGVIFGITPIKKTLMEVVNRKNIQLKFGHQLIKIDPTEKIAWYKLGDNEGIHNENVNVETIKKDGLIGIKYDFLHTAPPSVAPKFIQESDLVNEGGWLDVNIHTLQSNKYENVFGLGDVAALPTAKTGAAIRKQVPVLIDHLMSSINGEQSSSKSYNGYSSCPLLTDYGKMVLAEFDYEGNFTPDPKLKRMLVFNSHKEHWRLWMLKKYGLPYLYWNKMMKGVDV
ncbi:MAG: NAD(P)/FAD-dependent oxidoreductase [Crocinitomicaceae bacterium]|nr:NAD(P)/FAD-dependent oxidoreductase [Crocinitomicaceae bacterium]